MNVLVTGATTPLGIGLVDALLADSSVDRVLAVGGHGFATWKDPRVSYRCLDLTHPRAVHDLLWGAGRTLAIDTVIHAMQHRDAHGHGRHVHAQNVDATRELVLGCARHPTIQRLVVRSFGEVYALAHSTPDLIDEDGPLDFDPAAPQWVRDRVEGDLVACCTHAGELRVAVLRCAEILAPEMGSQLWDYLQSRICLRPAGFDPMLNVLSLSDAIVAFIAAIHRPATGVFNIVGYDSLPLSRAIEESGRLGVPIPSPLLAPLYQLRRRIAGFDFRYDLNLRRFHFGGVLDGKRASDELGYTPRTAVRWQ